MLKVLCVTSLIVGLAALCWADRDGDLIESRKGAKHVVLTGEEAKDPPPKKEAAPKKEAPKKGASK